MMALSREKVRRHREMNSLMGLRRIEVTVPESQVSVMRSIARLLSHDPRVGLMLRSSEADYLRELLSGRNDPLARSLVEKLDK
jgi:hypothetical protein